MFRLREVRKSANMSQQQLATTLGVTQATLSGWENEKYEIDNCSLDKCATLFNVSTDYLLGRTDEPNVKSLDEQLEGIDFALWGEVHDLTDEEKQDIINFAKFTKSKRKN